MVEEAGVELTLLDVEVTEKDGRPIHGLKKGDFVLYLNGREWPVYSVDDLCACEDLAATEDVAADDPGKTPSPPPVAPAAARGSSEPPTRFVLYLDFSQLQSDGRARAVSEAKRWIRDSLKPSDEVSIVAYATDAGLKERCPFTSDRQKLVDAVDAAHNDPKLFDAAAAFLPHRMCECGMYGGACVPDPAACPTYAVDEYFRSRRSLKALEQFLETLGESFGRKVVLYFNDSGVLMPGSLYGQGTHKGGDNFSLLDQVASAAIASRAAIYPVFTGDDLNGDAAVISGAAVNFGANLADATGGRYNRGMADLKKLMDAAAHAGCCTYRVGMQPPTGPRRDIYQVRVEAGGRKVSWLYRIHFDTELDRWLKRARSVLRNPAGSRDLPIGAALVPVKSSGGRWKLSVQVALDADAFAYLPGADGRDAQWQVGALVQREGGRESWEMLGVSSLHRKDTSGTAAALVHRTDLDDLRPGTYRLAAFVRDENTSLFGGAETVIDLPKPGVAGVAGPIVMRSPRKFFLAALPALAGKETKRSSVSAVREDALPTRTTPAIAREMLEAQTWLCPAPAGGAGTPVRFVSRDGVPQYRFDAAEPRPAGGCLLYTDAIDAARLPEGTYAYHFRWNAPGRTEPLESKVEFEVPVASAPR